MQQCYEVINHRVYFEALGWTGLVIALLVVLGGTGAIVYIIFFDWENAGAHLLSGIAVTLGLGYIVTAGSRFLSISPQKFVRCPYCSMKNTSDTIYCVRCGKLLPKQKRRLPHPKSFEKHYEYRARAQAKTQPPNLSRQYHSKTKARMNLFS